MFKIIDPIVSTPSDMKDACEYGFFYVPVPDNIDVKSIMELIRRYFSLPCAVKSLESAQQHPNGLGYLPSGRYKKDHGLTEVKESYQYQQNNLESQYKVQYDKYIESISGYAKKIFNLIILSLNADPNTYAKTVDPSFDTLTLIHYPVTFVTKGVKENKCGTVPHMDWGYLTLLATTASGLQIKRDNKWIDVPVSDSHFIVNIGNMMEILSAGKYKSIEHRVIVNEEKYSIAFFFEPKLDELIVPMTHDDNKGTYKPVTYDRYINNHMKNLRKAKVEPRTRIKNKLFQKS